MANKFYAVRSGRETGIFETWDECKRLVTGFKGAEYKGFMTLAEAPSTSPSSTSKPIPAEFPLAAFWPPEATTPWAAKIGTTNSTASSAGT